MALKPCRECGKKISTEATACPSCGVPNPTSIKATDKKIDDVYEKIWLYVESAHKLCESTFTYTSASLDKESEYRIWNICLYFYRGMFEASCEKHKLEKDNYKKAVTYCFRRGWDEEAYHKIPNEKKDAMSVQTYKDTENGLIGGGRTTKMCTMLVAAGNKSFKSEGAGCFAQLVKLWRDQSIAFTETGIGRGIRNLFGF